MSESKTLRLKFIDMDGDDVTVSIKYFKEDVTAAEVNTVLAAIVENQPFTYTLASSNGAEIVTRTVTAIE